MRSLNCALLSMGLIMHVGCTQNPPDNEPSSKIDKLQSSVDNHSIAGHGHGAGPHNGTIADWGGGKYHVEFTVDHDKTEATVYVLGGDEKTPAAIDATTIELNIVDPQMTVTLDASPEDSDPDGKASRFIGTHEKLGVVQEYEGSMTGVIDGTPYSGDFKEEAHEHE